MDSPSKHVFDHIRFSEKLGHQFLCEVWQVSNTRASRLRLFLIRFNSFHVFCSLNPLLDAEIATPCGHRFCGFCVEHFKANGKTACQKCKQPVTTYIKNRLANDLIAMVDGEYSWCGDMLKLDTAKHVRQCQLLERPCDLCHQLCKRQDL